jgi:thiol-disulfide isomerase/thioredoxin
MPLWLAGAGALLLIVALVVALTVDGKPAQARTQAQIPLLDGSTVNLDDYRGQVVLLNFWATWCPPCRAEMPELDAYYRQHRDDGFVLIAVNAGESAELARSFIEANGFSFPVGLDLNGDLTDEFGITGLPVSIVIDADGAIQYRHSGMISREVLDAQVTPLLGG